MVPPPLSTWGVVLVSGAKALTCLAVAWVLAKIIVELTDAQVTRWRLRKRGDR
jgi:hypothetical protein